MIRRGKTGVGLGALDVIIHCLGVLSDGFRVAGNGKSKITPTDGGGSTPSLIHIDWSKFFRSSVCVLDENAIQNDFIYCFNNFGTQMSEVISTNESIGGMENMAPVPRHISAAG